MFKRVVNVVQYLTLAAAVLAVVMLFVYNPGPGGSSAAGTGAGAEIYAQSCAGCHGSDGAGVYAPELAGVVAENIPDVGDEIRIVRDGRAGMPAFAGTLTDDQIIAVVEFTRTDLGAEAGGEDDAVGEFPGQSIYSGNCASCHGGDGQGGIGPELGGGAVVGAFPAEEDEIVVVTDGRAGMPPFDGRLTAEEIAQVVEYTRDGLG